MAEEIKTPTAPKTLPPKLQSEWRKKYVEAFKQAQTDHPDNPVLQEQFALREANRMLRSPEVKSYEDAAALPDHHVISRKEEDGKLKVVTADGKKHVFDSPKGKDKPLKSAQA
jgi:hypothetical protein